MKLSIGLQLYTVRDEMEKDFKGTLKKVKEIGYEGVEFAGLFGHCGSEVKSMLSEIGLQAVSAHVPLTELGDNIDETLNTYKEIGVSYIAIPYLPEEDRPEGGNFEETIANFIRIGEKVKGSNMKLLYHNHDFEFEKLDGEYVLDVIYNRVKEDLLHTELDTCWVNVGGENPAEYILKYANRSPIVHLKDFVMKGKPAKENLYELIGIDEKVKESEEAFAFRPVGYGNQDFESIIAASKEAMAKWVIVEQDRPAKGISPIESIKLSYDYVNTLSL